MKELVLNFIYNALDFLDIEFFINEKNFLNESTPLKEVFFNLLVSYCFKSWNF